MPSPELSNDNHKGALKRERGHQGIFLASGQIKLKSHAFSRGAFSVFMGNVKLGLVSLGLWLEVLNFFFI